MKSGSKISTRYVQTFSKRYGLDKKILKFIQNVGHFKPSNKEMDDTGYSKIEEWENKLIETPSL